MAPRRKPDPDFVSQRLDDELVLVNLRTNRIFTLNRTGARVWELVQTGHDWPEIRDALLREFVVEPGELDRELETLAASLASEGFVQNHVRGDSLPRSARPAAAPTGRARSSAATLGAHGTALLLVRMAAWSLVLPVLKRVLPLPALVRVMSSHYAGDRSEEKESQIVRNARRVYRLRRPGSCLERSLIAYRYLSRACAEPQVVIGVRREDANVVGHAWVLMDGSPLYESSAVLESFLPVVAFASDGYATTTMSGTSGSMPPMPRL